MFAKLIENKKFSGANTLIWKEAKIIHQESCGYKNWDNKELIDTDTLFRIASLSKPIISVLAMMLYEEKKFNLEDSICLWFPDFKHMRVWNNEQGQYEEAIREITILDLLTHRAGFTYSEFLTGKAREDYINILGADIDSERGVKEWIKGLASLPLQNQPGELFNYGKSTDLLGFLIAHIEGKPLYDVLKEKIFEPLAMLDTFFDVPDEKKHRCAVNMGYNSVGEMINIETVPLNMALKERPIGMEFQSGGSGLWSSMNDYLKFAQLFINNGISNGVQILTKESIDLMCTNQLSAYQREHSTLMGTAIFKENYGFGLGLAVILKESSYGSIPCSGSLGSVGWPGAYGAWWSADISNKSVSVFLSHNMAEPAQLAQGIGFELYEAIDIFSSYSKLS